MHKQSIAAILAIGALGGTAAADVLLTLTYDDLSGSYDAGEQLFTANAVDNGDLQSSGDVSKVVDGSDNAVFDPGFVDFAPANFVLDISVDLDAEGEDDSATGSGSFTATDADGDTITGALFGEWTHPGNGFIAFNGAVEDATVSLVNNGTFDGTAGGSWDAEGLPDTLDGAIVDLVFGAESFFGDEDFADKSTGTNVQLTPAPPGAALLGMGALAAIRRRRR